MVIFDHNGKFVAGAWQFFPNVAPEGAELLVCRDGLQVAKDSHLSQVVLETDNIEVAVKLNKEGLDQSVYGPLVCGMKSLLQSALGAADCKRSDT
jgi:hypothetical protein